MSSLVLHVQPLFIGGQDFVVVAALLLPENVDLAEVGVALPEGLLVKLKVATHLILLPAAVVDEIDHVLVAPELVLG